MRRFIPLLFLAAPAWAEAPFEGIWAHDPEWCAQADRIGSVTPAPIRITAEAFQGYENRCDITEVTEIEDLNAWQLSMTCMAEGMESEENRLLMLAEDRIWMWFGAGEPVSFERCEAG